MPNFTYISLFAGIGGFDLALNSLGGKCVFVCELSKFACQTYKANFETPNSLPNDINTIHILPACDVMVGGFPCQDFSFAGNKLGFEGDRGKLFYQLIRVINANKPKLMLFENVVMKEEIRKTITKELQTCGYTVVNQILNSADFGVPQNRKRNYWLCVRSDIPLGFFQWPSPQPKTTLKTILEPTVDPKYFLSERYLNSLAQRETRHQAKGNGFTYQPLNVDGIRDTIHVGGASKEANLIQIYKLAHTNQDCHVDSDLCPCLDQNKGYASHGIQQNQEGIRRLTPRECARLQGFPDTFRFVVSDSQLYTQFGNAVTVNVIKALMTKILPYLGI